MSRVLAALLVIVSMTATAHGQIFDALSLDRLNRKLCGHVVDHTQNHGRDRRIFSPILCMPRDLYVYLPPGYNPEMSYPLILFLHGADVDEHDFLDPVDLEALDRAMARGEMPLAVIAAPDGTYRGLNRVISVHSLWVNGLGGRFEDHIVHEVVPFVMQTYSIRPEREAHALLGISAGGYGAMAIALKHRNLFAVVATLAGPLNMRYANCQGRYSDDFDPATFCMRIDYNPNMIIARYFLGLLPRRVKTYFRPVYGDDPGLIARVTRDNPADLLDSTDLRPGELTIYVNYPELDHYNFDAQDLSFLWLAARRGVHIDVTEVLGAGHNLAYIERQEPVAYQWIGRHIPSAVRR